MKAKIYQQYDEIKKKLNEINESVEGIISIAGLMNKSEDKITEDELDALWDILDDIEEGFHLAEKKFEKFI